MAFFDKIKKSFGFSDSEDDYNYDFEEEKDATVKKREPYYEQKSKLFRTSG